MHPDPYPLRELGYNVDTRGAHTDCRRLGPDTTTLEVEVCEKCITEEWRPVVGYEGAYEVSSIGRVRSLDRRVPRGSGTTRVRARILKQTPLGGYPSVRLMRAGRGHRERAHTIVLKAFVGPRPDGMYGCHNDGCPTNNKVCNLRWDTPRANCIDRTSHLDVSEDPSRKLTRKDVRDIRRLREDGLTYQAISDLYPVGIVQVWRIVKRERWAHVD